MPTLTLFDGNAIWIVIGLSIVLTLLISAARALKGRARRSRVLGARLATVADARDGELVIVQGKARGEPSVTTLITSKSAIWMRTTVRGEVARPGLLRFTTLLRDVQGRAFTVEASGGRFDVATENARVAFAPERIARSYTPEEEPIDPRLLPLFRQHPDELKDALVEDKARVDLRTFEEAILPGDDVSIVGIARRSGPNGFHIEPSPDGLYVVLGDVKALAASGALWSDRPDV
ncbi:hypothetical protein [Pendulispora albinea]|uniref:RING-type E3 ubiquitin transferase n=1 Tax=Pendulispora albinea TaxID=2741071 RepID=A0ABZ2LRD2_9BACT